MPEPKLLDEETTFKVKNCLFGSRLIGKFPAEWSDRFGFARKISEAGDLMSE